MRLLLDFEMIFFQLTLRAIKVKITSVFMMIQDFFSIFNHKILCNAKS